MPRLPTLLLTLCIMTILPASAFAHGLGISYRIQDGRVTIEAFYDDDTAAAKAKVEIVDASGVSVASDVTDAEGKWTFPAPAPGTYEVRVDAGAGHRARKAITIPGPAEQPQDVSPTRAELTAVPWLQVAIGLLVIGGLSGAFLVASMLRRKSNSGNMTNG